MKMKPYRTNLRDVPRVGGLKRDEGWINMQVQFLIDQKSAGSDKLLIGRTVLPPGARHDKHRHPNADEFFIVIQGGGFIYTDTVREPSAQGDLIFTPPPHFHGFHTTHTKTLPSLSVS